MLDKVVRWRLDNGMTVLHLEDKSRVSVSYIIIYKAGSRHERPGESGIAHFLEHMLFKGTPQYGKGYLDSFTQQNAGFNNAFTWFDFTGYFATFASDAWKTSLMLEADRMINCLFDPVECELERQVVLEELHMVYDDPGELLIESVTSKAMPNHPYGRPVIGSVQDILNFSREKLHRFYSENYTPDNSIIAIAGNCSKTEVDEVLANTFGKLHSSVFNSEIPRTPHALLQREKRLTLKRDVKVKRVKIVYPAPAQDSPDLSAMVLLNNILGTGKLSRLYTSLVEEKRIATSIETQLCFTLEPFLLAIWVELNQNASEVEVVKEIDSIVHQLKTKLVSDDELQRQKKMLEADFVFNHERIEELTHVVAESEVLGGFEQLAIRMGEMKRVTAEVIQQVARKYLKRKYRVIGKLVPGKKTNTEQPDPDLEAIEKSEPELTSPTLFLNHEIPSQHINFKEIPLYDHLHCRLANGLSVAALHHPTIPAVCINLLIPAGSLFDPPEKSGVSNLTLRMLKEGTKKLDSREFARQIENLGARLWTRSGFRHVAIIIECLSEDLERCLNLMSDMVLIPLLDRSELTHEQALVMAHIQTQEEDPRAMAYNKFMKLLFNATQKEHPILGYQYSVAKVTQEDVHLFFERNYRPNQSLISVVGDIEPQSVLDMVNSAMGGWQSGSQPTSVERICVPDVTPQVVHVAMDKEQLNIVLGHPGITKTDPDIIPLIVMDYILGMGSGCTSRIQKRIRDDLGLAYDVYATISGSADYDQGCLDIYCGTHPDNRDKVISCVREEIQKFKELGVTEAEVVSACNSIIGAYVLLFETNHDLALLLTENMLYNRPYEYLANFPSLVRSVTPDQVREVARKHLKENLLTIVTAGPPTLDTNK